MAQQEEMNPCGGPMGFITIFVMMFVVMIMFDPSMGEAIVGLMDGVMTPIKFGDQHPIWTIVLSGLILVVITTIIRHKFTDWFEMAKTQKIQSEFNKELREATMSRNELRARKLQEKQPEILKLTNQLMMGNMKTMVFTMLFAILIWRWLYSYLETLDVTTVSLPWEPHFPITNRLACFVPFPYWILIYFVVSVPIGQVLINVFKVMEFSKDARDAEQVKVSDVETRLRSLDENIESARRGGVATTQAENLKAKVEAALDERNFGLAERQLLEAEAVIEQNTATRKKTLEMVETTRSMLESARARGIGVSSLEPMLASANAALNRRDYTKAIYHCKQCQQKLKIVKEKYGDAEEAIKGLKEQVAESPDSVQRLTGGQIADVERKLGEEHYEEVMEQVRRLKGEVDSTQKQFELARAEIETVKSLRDNLKKLSIDTLKYEDRLRKAEDRFNLTDYREALDLAKDLTEEMSKLKKLYESASESVSFAKLVVANAKNFGALVDNAELLLNDAEFALKNHDYEKALAKATSARNIAEEAKRQVQREQKRGKR